LRFFGGRHDLGVASWAFEIHNAFQFNDIPVDDAGANLLLRLSFLWISFLHEFFLISKSYIRRQRPYWLRTRGTNRFIAKSWMQVAGQ